MVRAEREVLRMGLNKYHVGGGGGARWSGGAGVRIAHALFLFLRTIPTDCTAPTVRMAGHTQIMIIVEYVDLVHKASKCPNVLDGHDRRN